MAERHDSYVDIAQLRIGLFIHLDTGWMDHPFSLSSFKIRSQDQIDTLRSLGLKRIRYCPDKSDPHVLQELAAALAVAAAASAAPALAEAHAPTPRTPDPLQQRRQLLSQQRASLQRCERQFGEATRLFKQVYKTAHSQPGSAKEQAGLLVDGFLQDITGEQETAIRLLSEKAGDESSLHALNVTVVSLLLGKIAGLSTNDMRELGIGALLHDIGKLDLPDRLRWQDEQSSPSERQIYQQHVSHGVELGKKMGLSPAAILVIAQHHEMADGSGYPMHLGNEKISNASRIVSLVNRYDNLCNPANPAQALTPHEALSMLFVQMKTRFDKAILALFIRMMGVYPPGSSVQLSDGRYAIVASVNSARPLKPKVVVYDPQIAKEDALLLDLESTPELGIKNSLKPIQLPRAVHDYLSPRKRLCYFFERARDLVEEVGE